MSKRSSDHIAPLAPSLKHARTEGPSTSSLQDMVQISDDAFEELHRNLSISDGTLQSVYFGVFFSSNARLQSHKGFVDLEQFMKNVNKDPVSKDEFLATFTKAAVNPLSHEDLKALIFHSMCFYFGTDQVANITLAAFWTQSKPSCKAGRLPCPIHNITLIMYRSFMS